MHQPGSGYIRRKNCRGDRSDDGSSTGGRSLRGDDRTNAKPEKAGAHALKGMAVRIEHLPVTSDLAPFVVGSFFPDREQLPAAVRIRREDGFSSPEAAIGNEGGFVLQASLQRYFRNVFTLSATDSAGSEIPLANTPIRDCPRRFHCRPAPFPERGGGACR